MNPCPECKGSGKVDAGPTSPGIKMSTMFGAKRICDMCRGRGTADIDRLLRDCMDHCSDLMQALGYLRGCKDDGTVPTLEDVPGLEARSYELFNRLWAVLQPAGSAPGVVRVYGK